MEEDEFDSNRRAQESVAEQLAAGVEQLHLADPPAKTEIMVLPVEGTGDVAPLQQLHQPDIGSCSDTRLSDTGLVTKDGGGSGESGELLQSTEEIFSVPP